MRYVYCFFFFQAEDGIRDYKVTGVQTVCSSDLPATAYFGDEGKAKRSAKADRTYVMEIDAYIAFMYPGSTNKGWFYYSLMYLLL